MEENSDEESDIKEVKISDIKDAFIKEEKENKLLQKKKERKQNKKKKRGELLKKYQEEINKEINEEKLKNENFLVATKKVKNAEANDLNKKKKKIYKKKNMRILIEDKNEMYRSVPQEVLEFKNKHLYGDRIKREKNFWGKI